jgi:hypothetical protein
MGTCPVAMDIYLRDRTSIIEILKLFKKSLVDFIVELNYNE